MDDGPGDAPPAGGTTYRLLREASIIAQLGRAMMERRLPAGLTQPHFTVLSHLARLGGTPTPLDLARAFQVPKASMTNTLAGLAARGLIETRPNPADGRGKLVALTPAGRAAHDAAVTSLDPVIAELEAALGAARLAALLPELEAIRRWLDTHRDL